MRTESHENPDPISVEVQEKEREKKDAFQESDQKIKDEVRVFFNTFSQKHRTQKRELEEQQEEELFLAYIKDLDANTPPVFSGEFSVMTDGIRHTQEELLQIDENDPGYVNERVLDYDNVSDRKSNIYKETGLHTGAIHWGNYATKEGVEYITLEEGKILSRWGDEKGTFLSDENVDYHSLELPVVEEKNRQNLYRVIKEFPVEVSRVASQPWNENKEGGTEAIQYRTPIPVRDLVEKGYLEKLENE